MPGYTITLPPTSGGQTISEFPDGVRVITWVLTSADPDGTPYIAPHRSDKSVHFLGTVGTATFALQGSNEVAAAPTSWVTLTDPSSTAISGTVLPRLEQVLENTYQVRPSLTTPGAGATVTVYLLITTQARR